MGTRVLSRLLPQVMHNCLISDAGYWGYYSTCGLLLRLREQYRFEHGINPGEALESKKVGDWIGKREADWQRLESAPLEPITINDRTYEPFDAESINDAIRGEGLVYGGGYGVYMKPVFFLAELDAVAKLDEYTVLRAGREHIRDLSIHPAMGRGSHIIARSGMARMIVHDRFLEAQARKGAGLLKRAFRAYGLGPEMQADGIREKLDEVARMELEAYIHHEAGELRESARLGPDWAGMVGAIGDNRQAALMVRGLKDALADTVDGGMLSHIIAHKNVGSLYLHSASLTGMRYTLLSPVRKAVKESTEGGAAGPDWDAIEQASGQVYKGSAALADKALHTFRSTSAKELPTAIEAALRHACPRS